MHTHSRHQSSKRFDRVWVMIDSLGASAHRDGYPSVMIDCCCAHKTVPNGSPLGFESSSCPHADDEVWLKPLAGEEGA